MNMRKTLLFSLAVSMVLLSPAIFAQDKPASTSSSQPTAGRKFSELSPEEQAKLRAKWQSGATESPAKPEAKPENTAAADKDKVKDKRRERAPEAAAGPQGRTHKEVITVEMTRLQQQHKANLAELQAIKELAIKENAKETSEALTQLIAKHERLFNQQMQVLQRKVKQMEGDQSTKVAPADRKKPESKKEESKPQNAGAKR